MKKTFISILTSIGLLSSEAIAEDSAFQFAKLRQAAISSAGKSAGKEIDLTLDYGYIIEKSMGDNWGSSTDLQKEQINLLLRKIIRSSLEKRLAGSNLTKVKWAGYLEFKPDITIVKSVAEVKRPSHEVFEIDYHVKKSPGGFKVIDVIFDGVSTVETYKRQFQKTIKIHGVDYLISKLTERASELSISEDDGC